MQHCRSLCIRGRLPWEGPHLSDKEHRVAVRHIEGVHVVDPLWHEAHQADAQRRLGGGQVVAHNQAHVAGLGGHTVDAQQLPVGALDVLHHMCPDH